MPEKIVNPELTPDLAAPSGLPSGCRFLRACLRQPVDHTPVWFLRQAGRYMPEYRAVRKQHSLLEICKKPALAACMTDIKMTAMMIQSAPLIGFLRKPR